MFPWVGSQTFKELNSPEDFHVMEVENLSRDGLTLPGLAAIASGNSEPDGTCAASLDCLGVVDDQVGLAFDRWARTNGSRVLGTLVTVQRSQDDIQITVPQHFGR
jgi:hypothetical protein